MKTKKLNKKLTLKKESIANVNYHYTVLAEKRPKSNDYLRC